MILALVLACRPLPGGDDYASQEDLSWLRDDEALASADPWAPGEARLTVGLFYEGGASHAVPIDNVGVFYYVYEGTYFQDTTDVRVEGTEADRLIHAGGPWFGGGVHFEDGARDFSVWSTLHLSVRSDDPAFEATRVGLTTADGEATTLLTDWGFSADDQWHALTIPLAEVASGLDYTLVPLLFLGGPGNAGSALILDDLYWTP
jgi:hypothetical protein